MLQRTAIDRQNIFDTAVPNRLFSFPQIGFLIFLSACLRLALAPSAGRGDAATGSAGSANQTRAAKQPSAAVQCLFFVIFEFPKDRWKNMLR